MIIYLCSIFLFIATAKSFDEFEQYETLVKNIPMHCYHLACILYGFYFIRNALDLKYHAIEQQFTSLTQTNILMKAITEDSKNPIVIFDQMFPIYGNRRFREEFGLNENEIEIKEIKKDDKSDVSKFRIIN